MSRRARIRDRQDMKRRPIPDSPIDWALIDADLKRRDPQPVQPKDRHAA